MSAETASTRSEPIREMICISCPIGCHLKLYEDDEGNLLVRGNRCSRGKEYAEEEYYAPKRIITATARTTSNAYPRVPVRTDVPLPKEHMDSLLREVYGMTVTLPVRRGDVLIEDYAGSGVNLVASMSIRGERIAEDDGGTDDEDETGQAVDTREDHDTEDDHE